MRPPAGGARWWRRRFFLAAVLASLVWVSFGVLFGVMGRGGDRVGDGGRGGPFPIVPAIVGAALVATFIAYRRFAGPVAVLLDGAKRIGDGDYDARVPPSGPRAVRARSGGRSTTWRRGSTRPRTPAAGSSPTQPRAADAAERATGGDRSPA